MEYHGKFQCIGGLNLTDEPFLLDIHGRMHAVEIKSGFPPGLYLFMGRKGRKFCHYILGAMLCVMGMDSHGGEYVRVFFHHFHGFLRCRKVYTRHHDGFHPCFPCSLKGFWKIILKTYIIYVCMAVK